MLCPLVFGIVCFTLHSLKWDVHREHQIDVLALDPEDCQKDADCVWYRRVKLTNELVALENYRGGGFVSPIVRYRGDTFYKARSSRVIISQGVEMEPRELL